MLVLLLTAATFAYAAHARVEAYQAFVQGAGEGLKTVLRVTPYLAAALLLTGLLRASGLAEWLLLVLGPLLDLAGIPRDLFALLLVRPLSGSAALSELDALIALYGPDSYQVRAACCAVGSSETVLYTIALYLGSIGVKSSRYILPIGLLSGLFGAFLGVILCKIL